MLEKLYDDCLCNVGKDVRDKDLGGFHELFLWAVICNQQKMMLLLFSRGEDFLRKALIGEHVSKLMIETGKKQRMLDDVISEYKNNERQDLIVFPLFDSLCLLF